MLFIVFRLTDLRTYYLFRSLSLSSSYPYSSLFFLLPLPHSLFPHLRHLSSFFVRRDSWTDAFPPYPSWEYVRDREREREMNLQDSIPLGILFPLSFNYAATPPLHTQCGCGTYQNTFCDFTNLRTISLTLSLSPPSSFLYPSLSLPHSLPLPLPFIIRIYMNVSTKFTVSQHWMDLSSSLFVETVRQTPFPPSPFPPLGIRVREREK